VTTFALQPAAAWNGVLARYLLTTRLRFEVFEIDALSFAALAVYVHEE
jgi:hypothetical protein